MGEVLNGIGYELKQKRCNQHCNPIHTKERFAPTQKEFTTEEESSSGWGSLTLANEVPHVWGLVITL